MSVVPIIIKALTAFSDRQVIVIPFGRPYIKKIGPSFSGTESLAVDALQFSIVMLVLHVFLFY